MGVDYFNCFKCDEICCFDETFVCHDCEERYCEDCADDVFAKYPRKHVEYDDDTDCKCYTEYDQYILNHPEDPNGDEGWDWFCQNGEMWRCFHCDPEEKKKEEIIRRNKIKEFTEVFRIKTSQIANAMIEWVEENMD